MKKCSLIFYIVMLLYVSVLVGIKPAAAERAALVFNPDTGTVLHAKNVKLKSYPASLTKLMTLYLLFEALDSKKIKLDDKVVVSADAGRQPPSRLGLKKGRQVTIEEVMLALVVKSANDAAVVAAGRIAGSEQGFVQVMNARAEAFGMSDTLFSNASGLPGHHQTTTALDIAVLVQKLIQDFPEYYPLLSRQSFQYRGKTFKRKNGFIKNSENIFPLKTGYTCQAGYNLVAAADRDQRRLVGVILGARNVGRRNASMVKLFNIAFNRQKLNQDTPTLRSLRDVPGQGFNGALNTAAIADNCIARRHAVRYDRISGWGLVVGVDKSAQLALDLASKKIRWFPKLLKDSKPAAIPYLKKVLLYRSYLTGLKEAAAIDACRHMRHRGYYCAVENPETIRKRVREGRVALKRVREAGS